MWCKKRGGKSIGLGQHLGIFVLIVGSAFNVFAQEKELLGQHNQHNVQTLELFVLSGTSIVRLDVDAYPGVKAIVHVVDEADQIKAGLNALLKKVNNEADAQRLVQPYFSDAEFVARLQRAHLSKLQAKRYGLSAYPSAVINRGEGLISGYVDMNVIVDIAVKKGHKQ